MPPTAAPTAPTTPVDPSTLPPTCWVRRWRVFKNGWHKNTLYTPEQVRTIANNYQRLRGHLTPKAALGHDRQKRVTESFGLPNVGLMDSPDAVQADDSGNLYLTIRNVPTWLGAQIEAERYYDGSVELLKELPDPADPSRKIAGPIIEAVAFLGDERPEVGGCDRPRATFDDGSYVPPSWEPLAVPSPGPSPPKPIVHSAHANASLCFSGSYGQMREQLVQQLIAKGYLPDALEGLDEEALKTMLGDVDKGKFSAEQCKMMSAHMSAQRKKFAAGDPGAGAGAGGGGMGGGGGAGGDVGALMSAFSAFTAKYSADQEENKKRIGAVEQFAATQQQAVQKDEQAKMSAYCTEVATQAVRELRIPRADLELHADQGVKAFTTKTFGAVAGDGQKAVEAWKTGLLSRSPVVRRDAIDDTSGKDTTGKLPAPEGAVRQLQSGSYLQNQNPRAYAALQRKAGMVPANN